MQRTDSPGARLTKVERQKRKAAERAVEFVQSGMRVGLGTGSTAHHVVDVIAERLASGKLRDIVGVPTSRATETHAGELGIPITTLEDIGALDVTIDGADEIGPGLDLIKGHGGALLWEKIVASASDRLIIVADATKLVKKLGTRSALPVEVVPFGWSTHVSFLRKWGARPVLRRVNEEPVLTDSGHYVIDCHFEGGIGDPVGVDTAFRARVGMIETGLFIGMADYAIVASERSVRVVERERAP